MSNITEKQVFNVETINQQLEKAYIASPYKDKFNLGVVQAHTMSWVKANQTLIAGIKDKASLLAFIYEGMLEGNIIGRDYWVVNYGGRPQFKKTQEGNKKWLSLNFDVIDFKSGIILQGDNFTADIGTGEFSHQIAFENMTTKITLDKIIGAYAQVIYKDKNTGREITKLKVIGKDYLDRVKKSSKTGRVWDLWPDKMVQAKASNELVKELQGLTQIYQSTGVGTVNLDEAIGLEDGKPVFASAEGSDRQQEVKEEDIAIPETIEVEEAETDFIGNNKGSTKIKEEPEGKDLLDGIEF